MNSFSDKQRQLFMQSIFSSVLLDEVVDYIATLLSPEEVFSYDELEDWAFQNGFMYKDDCEY